jgi:solute carrier family 25 (mitochondrial phosphate transporter), member 3
MAKFYSFEKIVKFFYDNVLTQPKEEYGKPVQLGVTFVSGYLAGVLCALVSHPADSLVSHMGKQEHQQKK